MKESDRPGASSVHSLRRWLVHPARVSASRPLAACAPGPCEDKQLGARHTCTESDVNQACSTPATHLCATDPLRDRWSRSSRSSGAKRPEDPAPSSFCFLSASLVALSSSDRSAHDGCVDSYLQREVWTTTRCDRNKGNSV
ncbi:unnamed protein product [Pleuronectes platessa]|uniref:Uncharacterized protein n=1 Tax=Pleuronectes platessa TaxID=8262 RepID=A0A9N7W287_PLEPL|nr:unnamed protein product [Pleuronectes platessa]